MTANQNSLYWREWSAVRRSSPAADRHALHVKALGADKSHDAFSNADFDKVLAVFRAITRPADLDAQLRQIDQPRARAMHAINQFPGALSQSICLDKFGHADPDRLTLEQLQQLAMTLTSRARAKRQKIAAEEPF